MHRILPALFALALLASGAAPFAPAAPSVAAEAFDQERFSAVTEQINRYWRQTLKDDGYRYREPYAQLVKGKLDTACGRIDPSVVAAYCPGDMTIYLAPEEIGKMIDQYGDFVPVVAVAHEWGHHIQTMLGVEDQKTIKMELQADCLAGAALGDAAEQGLVNKGDIKEATNLTRDALGDPEWLPRDSDQAHGSGDQRVRNLLAGYEQGVSACGLEELLTAASQTPTPEPPPAPTPEPTPTPPPVPTVDPNVAPPVDPAEQGGGRDREEQGDLPPAEPEPAPEQIQPEPAPVEPVPAEVPPVEETPVVVEEIPAVAEIPAPAPQEPAPAEPAPVEPVPVNPEPAAPVSAPAAATGGTILTGRLVLDSAELQQVDGGCAGAGDVADIAAGLPVVVQDADGNDIGLGALGPGIASADGAHCIFSFAVEGLTPSPVWSVRLGDRDPVAYDEAMLQQAGYRIAMRIAG